MRMNPRLFCLLASVFLPVMPGLAQVSLTPLATFAGGDGWLGATDSSTDYLTQTATGGATSNTERGLGYSPTTNHLYYVSRETVLDAAINVRILDAVTGADIGALDVTGITGGTFALNKIVAGGDGVIYGTNLRTGTTATTYKIYSWSTEASAPVTIFDKLPDTDTRVGDDLDAIGSGAGTQLVTGYGVAATAPDSNGYAVIDPTASAATPTNPVFNNVTFPEGTGAGQTVDGDFRLGITFLKGGVNGTVIGTQGASVTAARLTDFTGTTGTLRASLTLQVTNERVMDFATVGGVPLLATMETGGTTATPLLTAGTVRIYDMTDPTAPVFLASANNMPAGTPFENPNFAGDVRWGAITGNTATLYTLNTNNGIAAYTVTVVPEPSSAALLGIAAIGVALRRRR
jgi:hypothetical protein